MLPPPLVKMIEELSWQTQLNNANAELNNMERELKRISRRSKKAQ